MSIPTLPTTTKAVDFSFNLFSALSSSFLFNISQLQLTNISFRHCGVRYISSDAFTSFLSVEILDISENSIQFHILMEATKGLANSRLTDFNISSLFSVNALPDGFFQHLNSTPLSNISIRNNGLTSLRNDVFVGLQNLTFLDLSLNKIDSNDLNLSGFTELQILNLTMNELKRFPKFCDNEEFSLVPNLHTLLLGMNSITDTYSLYDMGHCLPNLKVLNLTYNPIRVVSGNSFSTIKDLEILSLANLFAYEVEFEVTAFNASSLKILHIGNILRKWPETINSSRIFLYCKNLEELDLTLFKLTYFKREDFSLMLKPLRKLKRLILDSSSLHEVPPVGNLPDLEVLILRKNYIRHVSKEDFRNNTKLKRLSISINHISVFTENSFPTFLLENIEQIDLAFNPYSCTCEIEWFLGWMKRHKEKLQSFPKFYECDSPRYRKKTPLINYNPDNNECHPISQYVVMAIVFGVVSVALVILGFIIRRYRWDIKYYIYLARSKRGYQRIPEQDGYLYDAFVAYNAADRPWVMSQLVGDLEKKHQYKLCLHERDFLPGDLIADQITEKVKASRRFILVISNNFAKSRWCQFEIFVAQNRLLDDGAEFIIPILLEDIKAKHMSTYLKFLLNSLTFFFFFFFFFIFVFFR
ncbi:hypothetical protein FSP39_005400 [Pinctada imbricata]|uniref:TIR domain-containing protein n=1 Tax=Pinctada imbricata TaxID=66713 RepID=A0AA88XQF2_PINIB|nr:hypothetical protein FSP39_005400 [Pinctada imbricata]